MSLSDKARKVDAAMSFVSATLWLFALVLFIVVLINFIVRSKNNSNKSNIIVRLAMAIFILMIIAAINLIYSRICDGYIYGFNDGIFTDTTITIEEFGNAIGTACYTITFILILVSFVNRLRIVFNGTKYEYPKWFFIILYVEIFVMLISSFVGEGLDVTFVKGIALLLLLFNCIFLTYLFYRSLKAIMKSTAEESLVKLMVKFVVLLTLCMSTSLILGIFLIAEGISDIDAFAYVVNTILPVDGCINVAAIYFQFKFADDFYFKLLGKYHKWIGNTFFGTSAILFEKNIAVEMSISTVKTSSPEASV